MLVADGDLLIGVVELDGEAGGEDGFGRRRGPVVLADGVGGEAWLSPFRGD